VSFTRPIISLVAISTKHSNIKGGSWKIAKDFFNNNSIDYPLAGFQGVIMSILSLIQKRRSIRSFEPTSLQDDDIKTLLEAARWAPSAGNKQPVEIVIVKSESQKRKLVGAALGQEFIAMAPTVLVVCANLERSSSRYGTRGSSLYAIQDAAAATQNILLTATDLGLGSIWVGAFDEEKVTEVLKLPSGIRPLSIVPIGMSTKESIAPPRRAIDEFTHNDYFGKS